MQNKLLLVALVASFCILTFNVIAEGDINRLNLSTNGNITAHTYLIKGIAAYKLGNYEEAIKCYDNAIALEPRNEIAEAGWAGKELAFYKLGKNDEALCCHLKLKDIDRNTNLIEKSKNRLLLSDTGSVRASWLWDGFLDNEGILLGFEESGILLIEEGASTIASGAGTMAILSNPLVVMGSIMVIGVVAYENREEIENIIDTALYGTNSTQININSTLKTFM